MRWLDGITNSVNMDLGGLWELVIWQIDGEAMKTVADYFSQLQTTAMVIAAMKLKDTYSSEGKL